MFSRLFKKNLVILICISYSVIANAGSVTVSDGSAFISKSEMSYQLNNLSNRMAQLEKTLDVRIDTLVSSYLTRNGIWNGAEQRLYLNQLIDMTGDNVHGANIIYSATFPNNLVAGSVVTFTQETYTLCTISKTGLCNLVAIVEDYGSKVTSDGRSYTYYKPRANRNVFHINNCHFSIICNGVEKANVVQFNWTQENIDTNFALVLKTVPSVNNLYFFVDKNDVLECEYEVGITVESGYSAQDLKGQSPATGITKTGLKINLDSCYVY